MKTKTFLFGLLSILSLILVVGFASAAPDIIAGTVSSPSSVSHNAGSFQVSFNLNNSAAVTDTISFSVSASQGTVTLGSPTSVSLGAGVTQTMTLFLNFPANQAGPLAFDITATNSTGTGSDSTGTQTVAISPSSTFTFTKTQELSVSQNGIVEVSNTGNTLLNMNISASGSLPVSLSQTAFALTAGNTQTITVSPTTTSLNFGKNTATITASSGSSSSQLTFTLDSGFCSAGEVGGDLTIKNVDIRNDGGSDDEWTPLDTIKVEIEVENEGDDDVDDVFVELALFDSSGTNVISDVDFETSDEEEVDLGNFKDGDEDTAIFEFKLPGDFKDGSYKLAAKVYSDDLGETAMCADHADDFSDDFYESIDVERDNDNLVVVDDIVLSSATATCGERVTARFDLFNIDEDQDQEQVKVRIFSNVLQIDEEIEIREDLNAGDGETLEIEFVVPSGLSDGKHEIAFTTFYDYDSRNDDYDEESQDIWKAFLNVVGCGENIAGTAKLNVDISATLASEAKAGKELLVNSEVVNTGSTTKTYTLSAKSFDSWATLNSISDRLFTLAPGESIDVELSFNVNKGVAGEETFVIEVASGDELDAREVAVSISPSLFSSLGSNTLLWVVGAINVLLIVIIVIVAARMSSR
jgi:hypothetical protein